MPISLCVFFWIRFQTTLATGVSQVDNVYAFAIFQWLWAVKNWVMGPLTRDSGLLTWLLVILSCLYESRTGLIVSTSIMGISFGGLFTIICVYAPWKSNYKAMSRRMKRSPEFCRIFLLYLLGSALFWGSYAVQFYLDYI